MVSGFFACRYATTISTKQHGRMKAIQTKISSLAKLSRMTNAIGENLALKQSLFSMSLICAGGEEGDVALFAYDTTDDKSYLPNIFETYIVKVPKAVKPEFALRKFCS